MKISDIHFPPSLLSALRDDSLVVFAGAGVSAGKPASLPNFRAFAESMPKAIIGRCWASRRSHIPRDSTTTTVG